MANVTLRNVKCRNNGRGGLAPLQVYGMSAVDCEFSGNGFPGGKYDWHSPGFGVDVEPDDISRHGARGSWRPRSRHADERHHRNHEHCGSPVTQFPVLSFRSGLRRSRPEVMK